MLNLNKKPTYDEMGNLIYPKSNKAKYILITLISLIVIIIGCILINNIFIKDRDVKECIELNTSHVVNKDLNGYMSDLSSKLPKTLRGNIRKAMKKSFETDKSKVKISVDNIKILKRDSNNAVVDVKMTKGKLTYTLRHLLIKEDGKFKFFRTIIVKKSN